MMRMAGLMSVAFLGSSVAVDAAVPVQFFCTISGAAMLKPKSAPEAICSRFKRGIEAANTIEMHSVAKLPKVKSPATRLVKVDVTFKQPGIASVIVTQQHRRKTKIYPEISIAVLDRAMDMRTIDQLVGEVARMIRR